MAPGAPFYQEVIKAIDQNPPPPRVAELEVLKELCETVDAVNKPAASDLARKLATLPGAEDPLHSISYELFHALLARVLLEGWFDEFELLLYWDQTRFQTKEQRVAGKWDGVLEIVPVPPGAPRLRHLFVPRLLLDLDREEEWRRLSNGLEGAFRHLQKVKMPTFSKVGAPPEPPPIWETILPDRLGQAIEHFFRLLQMSFQHTLELALARLELDQDDVHLLRNLLEVQTRLGKFLTVQAKRLDDARRWRSVWRRIEVAEYRYGRANQHRFLDAFPRFETRSVIFNSLDRDDKERPIVRGEKLENILFQRDRQIGFYFWAYGHMLDPRDLLSPWHKRRRAVIKTRHGGRLKLTGNDDFVELLSHFFEDRLAELTQPGSKDALPRDVASVEAWRDTVKVWNLYFSHLTTHSRLNLTEGPPNYLTHAFPRNIAGRLLHDCGVYGVRTAYTLLTVLERINRLHSTVAGTLQARWVLLPLHVGVLIESSSFGLLVQHNDHLSVLDNEEIAGVRALWEKPPHEPDPTVPAEVTLKLHEDIAASLFGSDLDMPIRSVPILDGEPVTVETIWKSYQQKVLRTKLFSNLVGAPNAKQYQFDIRYLRISELEREWYNEHIVPFWNVDCNRAWKKWKPRLTDPVINKDPQKLKETKQAYTDELLAALTAAHESYKKKVMPEKKTLNGDLRADSQLLLPGVRINSSARVGTVLPMAQTIKDHIRKVTNPQFIVTVDFLPPFARPDEWLLEVP
jgi:hypothetical protein